MAGQTTREEKTMRSRAKLVIALFSVVLLQSHLYAQNQPATTTAVQMRAVSLRVLQSKLAPGAPEGGTPDELPFLCGLTVISGYVIDNDSNDMILFGRVDPQRPQLHVEDLAVALRNAWFKYAKQQGHTIYYADPGCSIDPDPAVIQELRNAAKTILQGEVEESALKNWGDVCGHPQTVRTMGIPATTHFAKVMVDADYFMKRLVDGSEFLGLEGLTSLVDMTMTQAKGEILQSGKTSIPIESMNRFWFYPGRNQYAEDAGIVEIEKCPVVLLTELEHLAKDKITGTGRVNPLAQSFTESFSTCYNQIAEKRPLYYELEGLFRTVALAKIAKFKNTGIDLQCLLDQLPLMQTDVPITLPGLSNVKQFEHRWDVPNGYKVVQLCLPSCGGVDIGINVTASSFHRDQTGRLPRVRQALLSARSSSEALYWDFVLKTPYQPEQ
jgi:hypothetical protein